MHKDIYLDNAATTFPKPPEVYDYMMNMYKNYGFNKFYYPEKQKSIPVKLTESSVLLLLLLQHHFFVFYCIIKS